MVGLMFEILESRGGDRQSVSNAVFGLGKHRRRLTRNNLLGSTCLRQGTLHSHCLAMRSMIQMNWCCWDYARSRLLPSERLPVSAPMCRTCKGALGDGV